ncbi:Mss4-like protein [Crepidotus variabilis]|uniref:Mss4-like protein n=1 Tax=Crepidotus variabilis TaxID=179855 RepID=A0A9P6JX07_9AGAR|nr:Mss4-like protein [Crepidotus variabilis]
MSSSDISHTGHCFCMAVGYQVTGKPFLSAYCHCTLCQRSHGAAFISSLHFSASRFSWTHAKPHDTALDVFVTSETGKRYRCKACGSTIAFFNLEANEWSVWGAQLDRDEKGDFIGWDLLKPTAHIFYDTRLVDVKDDLGKWTGYEGESQRIA